MCRAVRFFCSSLSNFTNSRAECLPIIGVVNSLNGIKSIAQWQATLGAAPWVGDERDLRPVKGKSPMWQAGRFFTFAPNRATMRVKPTQGVASLRSPCPGL